MAHRVLKTLQRLAGNAARVFKGKTETKPSSPSSSRSGRNVSALAPAPLSPRKRAASLSPRRASRVTQCAKAQQLVEAGQKTEQHALKKLRVSDEEMFKLTESLSAMELGPPTVLIPAHVYCDVELDDWFTEQHLGKRAGEPLESERKQKRVRPNPREPLARKKLSPAAKMQLTKQLPLPFPASIVPAYIPFGGKVVPTATVPQPQSHYNMATFSLGESPTSNFATTELTAPQTEPAAGYAAALQETETALPGLYTGPITTDQPMNPSSEPATSVDDLIDYEEYEKLEQERLEQEMAPQGFASDISASATSTSTVAVNASPAEKPVYSDEEDARNMDDVLASFDNTDFKGLSHREQTDGLFRDLDQQQTALHARQSTVAFPQDPTAQESPEDHGEEQQGEPQGAVLQETSSEGIPAQQSSPPQGSKKKTQSAGPLPPPPPQQQQPSRHPDPDDSKTDAELAAEDAARNAPIDAYIKSIWEPRRQLAIAAAEMQAAFGDLDVGK